PERQAGNNEANTRWQRFLNWFSVPRMDKFVIYISLAMFIIGTMTLLIDQNQKEKIRNNGLRMKQYFITKNNYAVSRSSLIKGDFRLFNLSSKDINKVLELYPNEFIEVDDSTIILRDSVTMTKIISTSEKLLDNFLSNPYVSDTQDIDSLFDRSTFFTREVVYKLIVDSSHKYTFCLSTCKRPSIIIRRRSP